MIKFGGILIALKLQQIFAHRKDVRGQTTPTGLYRDDGKEEVKVQMFKEDIGIKHFIKHINGELPALGLVPITPPEKDDDETHYCKWGCLDIDEYNFDHKQLIENINKLDLPMVVFRSKSGGAHVFLFCEEWISARVMRSKLKMIQKALGYQGCEIFPKQDEAGDFGSFLNIPYFNGTYTSRYAFDDDGNTVFIDDLGFLYDKKVQSKDQIEKISVSATKVKKIKDNEAFPDGPPCLNTLAKQGFTPGSRNEALYNIGVYAKKAFSEGEWQQKVSQYNQEYFQPPLGYTEEQATIKSLMKKDFKYKCKLPPIEPVCQASKCQFCKYGVGGNKYQLPEITNLIKICVEPVSYLVTVDGKQVKLTSDQWLKPAFFADAVYNQTNIGIPRMPKKEEWMTMVVMPLSEEGSIQEVKGIESFTPTYRLESFLKEFITGRNAGDEMDDLANGVTYTDRDKKQTYIRTEDFVNYCTRNGWKHSWQETHTLMVDMGRDEKSIFKKAARRMVRGSYIGVLITKMIERKQTKKVDKSYDNEPF